jgi:XTP/dITP diphosphohydrolase
VLATANRAKAVELRVLLGPLPCSVLDLTAFPSVTLPEEGSVSYEENALEKARAAARATGMLALADDSGIEVDALGGGPGVLSARYGGEGLDDEGRCRAMLLELRGVPRQRRQARYRCVVALCSPEGREATAEGVAEGVLLEELRGIGGFGYDPLFYFPPLGATFAEVGADAKHAVSHRGRAMARIRPILLEWLAHA